MFLFDEIDAFKESLQSPSQPISEGKREKSRDYIDEVLDLLIMAYVLGTEDASVQLDEEVSPDMDEMKEAIELKIDGKGFRERIKEHLDTGDIGLIGTVADTDAIRVYNTAVLNTGLKLGASTKTWRTMEDEKVRDSHVILDGQTIPIDAYFYTMGDKALQPGGFETAEENCNCRCILEVH